MWKREVEFGKRNDRWGNAWRSEEEDGKRMNK